jgi:hypothetical protein
MKSFSVQNSIEAIFTDRIPSTEKELESLNAIRVIALNSIILGNTFYYMLKGPIQNLEAIQDFMSHFFFTIVISADLLVDIFFWMTAFIATYFLLIRLKVSYGSFGGWKSVMRIYLHRVMRLLPTYMFALFFFWKFIVLFGGEGPMFFMYSTMTECSKLWIWHLTFLNNVIPWSKDDTCMPWTWYIANDMQFFLLVPLFAHLYFNKRRQFYYLIGGSFGLCKLIQMIVILVNDLSVSYFTYNDEYWTVYYVKPYSRLPVFLIGVLAACSFFTMKHEDPENMRIAKVL